MNQIIAPDRDAAMTVVGLPALRDNRIWCLSRHERHGGAVLVDPGEGAPALAYLDRSALRPIAILLTHHHHDHVGGVEELLERWPETPVYGPGAESITGVSHPLAGGETLRLLAADWRVFAVPGHTRGHLAYGLARDGDQPPRVFSGDVLFGLGCGRLFEGTAAQMVAALDLLCAFPDDTAIHCAHEYTAMNLPFAEAVRGDAAANPALAARAERIRRAVADGASTLPLRLGEEKATNPFLRLDDPAMLAALACRAAQRGARLDSSDRIAVFAALREWRNQF